MLDPSIIKAMIESGCTAKQIAAVVNAYLATIDPKNDSQEVLLAQRAKNRELQRKFRASKAGGANA